MTEQAMADSQPQPAMNIEKMLGSLISLITQAKVRYEGTLISVDQKRRSMHLTNVKSYGSEGRRGVGEFPATDNIIQNVVFKVDHIIDFKIVKKPEPKDEKDKNVERDPAIISENLDKGAQEDYDRMDQYGVKD